MATAPNDVGCRSPRQAGNAQGCPARLPAGIGLLRWTLARQIAYQLGNTAPLNLVRMNSFTSAV